MASSDLPFIIKVEVSPESTCWPADSVVLMALNAKDKDAWVSGNESLVSSHVGAYARFPGLQRFFPADSPASKLETLVKLPANLVVNCLMELTENIKVLGTDQGLFSYYNDSINALRVEGVANVEQVEAKRANLRVEVKIVLLQIALFEDAVLMIQGAQLTLIGCDVNHLINLTQCAPCGKPTLKYQHINVNNLSGFHLLQVKLFLFPAPFLGQKCCYLCRVYA